MLSTANPPADPSSDEISKLKRGNFITSDGKPNNYLEADLLKSGLDDISQTLPKFSIRGYVYKTRGKTIKTHWPFSPKSLQLCLKHGIKDMLPPFETLDSVRNPSAANLLGSSDCLLPVSPNKDKEYYPSDVNLVSFRIKSPNMKPKIAVRAANKIRSNISTQNQAKKCRLIMKVGKNDISEDLSVPMSSKVCMVCKAFKSSSNTTLNAHMDQCLSGVSTSVKWTADPKAIKHRIKPRKTRLMVDIYETAVPCTLEDLDIRNGTNWSSNLGFQAQENNDINDNNKNHFMSNGEDKKEEEGAVYIDSNGTKVRILSRLSDVKFNSNGEGDDCGPRKLVKRDKESKIVRSKKMKLLKSQPYEQIRSTRLDSCPKINKAPEINFSNEETEKDNVPQPLKACDLQTKTNSNDSGMKKPKVSSKRKGHKIPDHKTDHHPKNKHNSRITTCPHPLDNNPLSASESDRTSNENDSDTSFSSGDEYMPKQQQQQSCLTNRACFYFSDSLYDHDNNKNDRKMRSSSNLKRLKENRSTVNVDRRPFISSRGKKLSTLTTNNSLAIRRKSFPELTCLGSRKRLSGFSKPAIRMRNNYPVEKRGEIDETRVEKESRLLKIQKKRWGFLNNTASSSKSDSHVSERNNVNSFVGHIMPAGTSSSARAVEISYEFGCEEQPLAAFGDGFTAEVNVSKVEGNYFVNVDPIPIPGPPGSFLPSPGRMGLEELQGNSSLTSCRLRSSEDERELIIDRMDTSDSLISSASFVSNSIAARSDPLLTFQTFRPHVNSKMNEPRVKSVFPESPSPVTPNPVLRLMGKDLMVVNKEEKPLTQCGPVGFVSTANGFPNRPPLAEDVINFSRAPFVFEDAETHTPFNFASNFSTLPQSPAPHHEPRGFGSSYNLDYCHRYASGPAFTPHFSNCGGKHKEIIIIDDSPEYEPTLGNKHVNPFFDYKTQCNYPNVPIQNRNSVVWNCDPHGGPSLQRRDLFDAPSQSTGRHERSSFYFSNGFLLPSHFS